MQLLYVKFLSAYKQFKANQLITFSNQEDNGLDSFVLNISVLVGRNGSGKTTLMSAIAQFFYHIERYNGKIPAEMEVCYVIGGFGKLRKVLLSHLDNNLTISVDGLYDKVQIIPRKSPTQWDHSVIKKGRPADIFDLFIQYLPTSVVTSVFSMHNEYPTRRPPNYEGLRIIADRSITLMYGKDHYELGSISRGILRFLRMYLAKGSKVKSLLNLFDLKFSGRVLHRELNSLGEYPENTETWINVTGQWLEDNTAGIEKEEIYLNDIEFNREGRSISLANMSSGEKMLLLRTISILEAIEQQSIVIIEEPELHLDAVWNRQLVTLFRTFFARYRAHIIIATHDFSLINAVPPSQLIKLDRGQDMNISQTFLASYEDLFSTLYGDEVRNNKIEDQLLNDLEDKPVEELKKIYTEMGNSIYKYLVYKKILASENDVEGNK